MNMGHQENANLEDHDGFLKEITKWTRDVAVKLARKNNIGPLTEDHWKIIEYVKDYYLLYGSGPSIVKISRKTGFTSKHICRLFPCGVARGAYRLAGLPRPHGCL